MWQISLTFPDGSSHAFKSGVTGRDVAESILKSLAKKAVAIQLDGHARDLAQPIKQDARVRILARDDPEALELIRHDAAHVMAEAVQELYPGTQVTIGPVIENGFYYDFARTEPFTPDDLPKIEAKMREIIARDAPFTCEVIDRKVPEMLQLVGLGEKFDRFPHQLSGGEQQRVSIARAFVNHPPLLLADEPTGNLDPVTSIGIMQLLYRINRAGTTILMVTHDREMVDKMRKRVIALEDGNLIRDERRGGYGTE